MSRHIKSHFGLTRCSSCRAHVRAGETPSATECPFCGANLSTAPARIVRAGKGGLLAASLLAMSACNGAGSASQEPTSDPVAEEDRSESTGGSENTNDDSYETQPDDPVAVEAYGSPPDEPPPSPPPTPAYGVAPPPG